MRNATSILQNIPSSRVNLVDNHAYISIKEIVHHFCAYGLPIDEIKLNVVNSESNPKHALSLTKEADNIRQAIKNGLNSTVVPLILYIIVWADDFEVYRVKKNRQSAWIMTVTICPPMGMNASNLYTYPVAV